VEESDIDGYDWDWSAKYLDEVIEELTEAYAKSFIVSLEPDVEVKQTISGDNVQRIAAEWARARGAEQIVFIAEETKIKVRNLVRAGILSGHPIGRIANAINGDFIFSALRAARIARTETATALGQGAKGAAIFQGRNEKRWVTSGDSLVSVECNMNEGAGWIATADSFPSGVDTVPQHPNCRCNVRYRTKELHDVIASFRCDGCNRLLGKEVHYGTRIVCRHCKSERIATGGA
jgi:hypothetical protein